jgi:hypothetical protein
LIDYSINTTGLSNWSFDWAGSANQRTVFEPDAGVPAAMKSYVFGKAGDGIPCGRRRRHGAGKRVQSFGSACRSLDWAAA